jgi:hypothetical protein
VDSVASLSKAGRDSIQKMLPELLPWIREGASPVARELAPLLAEMGSAIVPEIRKVLTGKDELWKYWVLELIVSQMDPRHIRALKPVIEELSRKDSDEEVDFVASEILEKISAR